MRNVGYVFLTLGIAFLAIGLTGRRTFTFLGLVFLVVGILRFLPRRR